MVYDYLPNEILNHRRDDAEHETNRHPHIPAMQTEHLLCERPGDGIRVQNLDVLTGPDVRTLRGEQSLSLRCNNGFHHDVVDRRTDDRAPHLGEEHHAWRNLH